MKSTAHIAGHPLHPVLIPYPFAFLTGAAAFDVAARFGGPALSQTARHLARVGLGSAVLAAVPGIIDYFGSIPRGTDTRRKATYHALVNLSALTCFAIGEARRPRDEMQRNGLFFPLLGTGLLSIGGWLGGEMVYHDRVAVQEHTDDRQAPSIEQPRTQMQIAGEHGPDGAARTDQWQPVERMPRALA